MTLKKAGCAGALAAALLICMLPGALAGHVIYAGEETAAPGTLYPYEPAEGSCLIDLSGNVYADDGYLEIYTLVSDANERRFTAITAEGDSMRCYLLDEKGQRLTDGQCIWISLDGTDIIFQSVNELYGLYGWDGETLIEPIYKTLMPTREGSYIGLYDEIWRIGNGEADLIRIGAPVEKISLGGGNVRTLYNFFDGLAVAYIYDGERDLAGFIDAAGQWRIPPVYDYCGSFAGDYAIASLHGYTGLIDRDGDTVMPFIYDSITFDWDGQANVLAAREGTVVSVYDAETLEELFEVDDVDYCNIEQGIALVVRSASDDRTRAYDLEGRLICEVPGDQGLHIISGGRYCVISYSDYTYTLYDDHHDTIMSGTGLLDTVTGADGICAIELTVSDIIRFSDGSSGFDWRNARCGLYGLDGRAILEPKYDYIRQVCEGYYSVQRGRWHGIVDSGGNWVIRRSNYSSLMD